MVSVQIACDGKIISDQTSFEFRDRSHDMTVYKAWFICEGERERTFHQSVRKDFSSFQ